MGNFIIVSLPKSLGDVAEGNTFIKRVTTSFRKSLDQFNNLVKSNGGRLFVMEVFPPPCTLDPDRSKLSERHQSIGWKLFLDLNELIKDFNLMNGVQHTLNVSSYLRAKIKLRSNGKRKGLKKDCVELYLKEEESGNRRRKRWESKINKNLHQEDNAHLLEPMRLVVSKVIIKVIKEKKRV